MTTFAAFDHLDTVVAQPTGIRDRADAGVIDATLTGATVIDGTPTDAAWREHANCKGRTRLFFAPKAERPQARERREAKARLLCATCSVRQPCQEFARQNHEYGFWGGESEEDRHLLGYTVSAPIGIRARAVGAQHETLRRDALREELHVELLGVHPMAGG